jgi:GAF domain-containing protein
MNLTEGQESLSAHDGGESGSQPQDSLENSAPLFDNELVALHEVLRSLTQGRGLKSTLRIIAEKALHLTHCESTAIALLDKDRQMLDFVAVAGKSASDKVGQRLHVEHALPGHTALSGEPLLAYDPGLGRAFYPDAALSASYSTSPNSQGVRSAAVVAIFCDERPSGSFTAMNRVDGQSFNGRDLLILQLLSSAASAVIERESLRRQKAQIERERDILYQATGTTSSSLDVQHILDGVLDTLVKNVDVFCAAVFLLNDERTHLYIAADRGLTEEEREIQLLPDGRFAQSVLAGAPMLIDNPATHPMHEDIVLADRAVPMSVLVAPLMSRDNSLGLVYVASLQPSAYTQTDLRLLTSVGGQAAIALENASLYEEATRRAEEATAIYELSQAVNTNLDLPHVLNFVADSVVSLLQVDKLVVFLHDPVTDELQVKVSRNLRPDAVLAMRATRDAGGIAWWVFEYQTPTAVQDVAADHRNRTCPINPADAASLVSVPLQAGDDVLGVIHAMSSRRRSFTVSEMELLYTIANQAGVAISNIRILADTRHKSQELRRSFRRVARALGTSLTVAQTAATIADLASEIMHVDKAVLYMVDPVDRRLFIRATHGLRGLVPNPVRLSDTDTMESNAGWIARKGRSVAMANVLVETRFASPQVVSAAVGRVGAYLGVPLKLGKQTVGVLEIYSREIRQLLAFAAQAGVAMQNATLVEQAERQQREVQLLTEMTIVLGRRPRASIQYGELVRLFTESVRAVAGLLAVQGIPGNSDHSDFTWNSGSPDYALDQLIAVNAMVRESRTKQRVTVADPDTGFAAFIAMGVPVGTIGELSVLHPLDTSRADVRDLPLLDTVADLIVRRLGL